MTSEDSLPGNFVIKFYFVVVKLLYLRRAAFLTHLLQDYRASTSIYIGAFKQEVSEVDTDMDRSLKLLC